MVRFCVSLAMLVLEMATGSMVEMAGVMVGVVFESVQAVFMVKWWRTIQWVVWMMGL